MTILIDPEGNELNALFSLNPFWMGKSVLEVGSGHGRLTWSYIEKVANATAIESDPEKHAQALADFPSKKKKVNLLNLDLDAFIKQNKEKFDMAILPGSLCYVEAEKMVGILEQIHDLLKPLEEMQAAPTVSPEDEPGSQLIDIHPTGEAVALIRMVEGREQLVGYLQDKDDYKKYQQADEAIEAAISGGLFDFEKLAEFDFHTYADSFASLKTFLKDDWSNIIIPESVATKAEMLDAEHGKHTVFLRERVRITLLRYP